MAVKGASPVTFISEDTQPGKQYQIPLPLLSFDATGTAIDASARTPLSHIQEVPSSPHAIVPATTTSWNFLNTVD